MDERNGRILGTVAMLRRYPVKSMLGEARSALSVKARGIVGDRTWAVLDGATGKVASAKRPKLWRGLLGCAVRALDEENQADGGVAVCPGASGFVENDWVGATMRIGESMALRVVMQTPRCAIPTLAHGALPPRTGALRAPADHNRVEIPGFGKQPCAGVYAEVLHDGTIREGDPIAFD